MQNFKIFLLGIGFGAFISGILTLFLKKHPIFFIETNKFYSFYTIDLTPLFFKNINYKKTYSLKGVKLKGLYFDGKKGFVILNEKNKNYFVDLGKDFKGYTLIKIGENFAILRKNGKLFKVQMSKITFDKNFINNIYFPMKISKKTILNYKNNFNKIWQNIGIIKVSKGYKITYINKNSDFYKIGLRRGDILLEVNGIKLRTDADAWYIYKNLDKFKIFSLKILRNNQIKVLNYEMD